MVTVFDRAEMSCLWIFVLSFITNIVMKWGPGPEPSWLVPSKKSGSTLTAPSMFGRGLLRTEAKLEGQSAGDRLGGGLISTRGCQGPWETGRLHHLLIQAHRPIHHQGNCLGVCQHHCHQLHHRVSWDLWWGCLVTGKALGEGYSCRKCLLSIATRWKTQKVSVSLLGVDGRWELMA